MVKVDVVILGLGYVGLPTAALIASKQIFVHGVDTNKKIIDGIKNEKIHINEPGLNSLITMNYSNSLLRGNIIE